MPACSSLLDGVNLGAEDTVSPYSVPWDTTTATNGTHFLTAVARDTAGGTGTATTVAVTVANDLTAPTVVMTRPGRRHDGLRHVPVGLGGGLRRTSASPACSSCSTARRSAPKTPAAPYAIIWDATTASAGTHTLSAKARDAFGRQTTSSAAVSVTVASSVPSITWPAPANIVYGTALSATQLNATSSVARDVCLQPGGAEPVLPAGVRTLSVAFTPTDSINFDAGDSDRAAHRR